MEGPALRASDGPGALNLDADPLADIHNSERIRWVIKNGELYEAETMKRLWPSVLEAPRQYWQE